MSPTFGGRLRQVAAVVGSGCGRLCLTSGIEGARVNILSLSSLLPSLRSMHRLPFPSLPFLAFPSIPNLDVDPARTCGSLCVCRTTTGLPLLPVCRFQELCAGCFTLDLRHGIAFTVVASLLLLRLAEVFVWFGCVKRKRTCVVVWKVECVCVYV